MKTKQLKNIKQSYQFGINKKMFVISLQNLDKTIHNSDNQL
jgi:hypothetical protein